MKQMWVECTVCKKSVRNSMVEIRQHAEACAQVRVEEAQQVAVAAIVERNRLRAENQRLRERLQGTTGTIEHIDVRVAS